MGFRQGRGDLEVWSRLASPLQWAFGGCMAAAECRGSVRRSDPQAFERDRWAPAFAGATWVRMRVVGHEGSRRPLWKTQAARKHESARRRFRGGSDRIAMVGFAALTATLRGPMSWSNVVVPRRDPVSRWCGGGYLPATTLTISRHLVE